MESRHIIPPPYCSLDLFLVVLSSTPWLHCWNSQLVSLPPVGILNSYVLFAMLVYLFTASPISTLELNTVHSTVKYSFSSSSFSCILPEVWMYNPIFGYCSSSGKYSVDKSRTQACWCNVLLWIRCCFSSHCKLFVVLFFPQVLL